MDNKEYILGEHRDAVPFHGKQDYRQFALDLCNQASKYILILSRDLDHAVYDNQEMVEAIKSMAIASRYSYTRILVQNTENIVAYGHRLVQLSQKLSSHVFIRTAGKRHKNFNEAFLVVDGIGYIHRPVADRYEGSVYYNNRKDALNWTEFFTEAWENGEISQDCRRLYL